MKPPPLHRILAFLLALQMLLPSPALGLRQQPPVEAKPTTLSGLEETLAGVESVNVPLLRRKLSVSKGIHLPNDKFTSDFIRFIQKNPERFSGRQVLQIGCGAGPITIALLRAGAYITAVDILLEAVEDARRNIAEESPSVRARVAALGVSDVYQSLPKLTGKRRPKFDVIVSAHPIIKHRQIPGVPWSSAIAAGPDFEMPRAILKELPAYLNPAGSYYSLADINSLEEDAWTEKHLRSYLPLGYQAVVVDDQDEDFCVFEVSSAGLEEITQAAGGWQQDGWVVSASDFVHPFAEALKMTEAAGTEGDAVWQRRRETLRSLFRLLNILHNPSAENAVMRSELKRGGKGGVSYDIQIYFPAPEGPLTAWMSFRIDHEAPQISIRLTRHGDREQKSWLGEMRLGWDVQDSHPMHLDVLDNPFKRWAHHLWLQNAFGEDKETFRTFQRHLLEVIQNTPNNTGRKGLFELPAEKDRRRLSESAFRWEEAGLVASAQAFAAPFLYALDLSDRRNTGDPTWRRRRETLRVFSRLLQLLREPINPHAISQVDVTTTRARDQKITLSFLDDAERRTEAELTFRAEGFAPLISVGLLRNGRELGMLRFGWDIGENYPIRRRHCHLDAQDHSGRDVFRWVHRRNFEGAFGRDEKVNQKQWFMELQKHLRTIALAIPKQAGLEETAEAEQLNALAEEWAFQRHGADGTYHDTLAQRIRAAAPAGRAERWVVLARAMGMPVDAVPRNFARRTLGLLVPLHALPRGIEDLEDLSEWAKQRGITWLQFLPLMEGDPVIETSPYSSWSAFAAKPLPIVPERVPEVQRSKEALDKLRYYRPFLDAVHRAGRRSQIKEFRVLYEVMWPAYRLFRDRVLTSTAAQDVQRAEEFRAYQQRNPWLKDYAAFRTLHSRYPDGWMTMPEELRDRYPGAVERLFRQDTALADMAQFYQYLQFVFDQQWTAWRSLSHRNGTFSLGDIPVYIAANSDLVWANQSSFNPAIESSCPPDLFTPAGQIWGHWTWNIPELRRTLFDVWMQRVVRGAEMTDGTRIDHVRFMYDFYGIPLLPDAERWLGKEAGKLTLRDAVSKLSDAWKSKVWVSEANPPVQGLPFPVETTAAILPGLPQRDQTLFGNLSPIQRDPFDRAMRMLEGAWNEGPGDELMQRISAVITFDRLGLLVAEDLGLLSDGVRPLLERTGTPGMAPVVFGISFDEKTEEVKFFGPYWDVGEAPPDLFVFSTNHDSDTFRGMLEAWGARYAGKALPQLAKKLQAEGHLAADFNLHQPDLDMVEPIHFALLLKVLRSPALQAFVSYQDLLRLTIGDNKPGVVSPENWSVVMPVSPKELLENKTERAQAINARTDALLRAPGVDRAPAPIIPGERPRILRMLPQPGGRTKVLQLRRHRDPVLGNVQAWAVVSPARDQIGRGRQPKAEMVVETGGTETALPMRLYSVLEDGTLLYYGQAPAERFPPGEYTLHTRVQGTDGTWHTDMEYGAAPRLVIEPAAGLEESGEILRAVDETAWAQLQAFGARLRELGLSWDRPVQITGVWTDKDYTLLNGDTGKTIHPSLAGDFAWMMDRGKKVVVVTADTPESVEQQVWLPIQGVPGDPAGRRARMRTFARSGGSRVFYPGGQRAVEPGGSVLTERQQTVLIRAFAEILLPQMGQPRDLAAAADFNAVKDVLVAAEQAAGLLRPNDVPVQIEPENPTMLFITFADGTLNSEEIVRQARAKIEQELQGEPAIIHFSCGPYYVAAGLYNKPSTTSRFLSVEFETEKEPGVLIVMGDGSLDDLGMIRAAAESRRHLILPCFVGDPEAIQPGEPVLVPDGRRYVEAARSVVGNVVKAEKLGLAYDQMEFIRGRFSVRQIAEALSVPTDAFLREILPSGFAGFERLRQARSAGLEEEWILVVGPSPEKIRQVIDSAKRSCPSAQFSSFMVGVDRAEFRNFISHSHLFRGALWLPFDSDDQAAERVSQWSTANDFLDTLKIPKVVLRDVSDSSVDQAVAQLLAYEVKDPILRRIKLLYRFTEKAWTEWTEGLRTPEGQLPFILFLKGRYRREPDLKSAGVLWPDLVRLYWNSEELPRRPPKESWREIYLYAVTAQIFYRLSIRYGDPEQSTDPQAILEALAPEITMLPQILFGQPAREIGLDGSETAEILRRIEQARKMIGLPAAGLEERTFLYNKFKVRSALLPEAPPPYSKVEIAVHGHLWGIPGNPLWQSFAGLRNVSWKSVSYHPDDAADELKGFVSDEAVWRIVILDPRYFPKEQLAQKLPAGHAPVFLMSPASAKLFTPAVAAEIMDMRPRADLPPIYDLELEEDDVYGGLLLSISA